CMTRPVYLGLILAVLTLSTIEGVPRLLAARAPHPAGAPEFTSDGKLVRPRDYRKWVFLSSGYGMSYSQTPSDHLMFTNVFVPPADYDYFLAHGTWPEKTMFVLEEYMSQSKGSINQHGNFQTELMGLDVEVKDASRFPDTWAYFGFDATQSS